MNTLRNLSKSKKIVSVHYRPETDDEYISVGYIDRIGKSDLRILVISTDGAENGYDLIRLRDIFRVDVDGIYEKKIEFLNKKFIYERTLLSGKSNKNDTFLSTLQEASNKRLVIVVWTKEGKIISGFVKKVKGKMVTFSVLDDNGKDDGTTMINSDYITSMECDTRQAQILKFLNTQNVQ